MANIHILTTGGRVINALAHIAVPNTNNAAGMNYRAAIVASKIGGTTQLPDGDGTDGTISAAEKTSIQSGALVEVPLSIQRAALPATAPERNAFLDALHAAETTKAQAEWQERLRYYGATR